MSRKLLTRVFIGLCLLMVGVASIPFIQALQSNPEAQSDTPRVKIPGLKPKQFSFVESPRADHKANLRLLFVRKPDGTLMVWEFPVREGAIAMPDLHWSRPAAPCLGFVPNLEENLIQCSDPGLSEWQKNAYRWTLDGKNLSGTVDNLPDPGGHEELGDYVFRPGTPRLD